jgi:hypothetical protein
LRLAAAKTEHSTRPIGEVQRDALKWMVGATGIEPVTPTMSTRVGIIGLSGKGASRQFFCDGEIHQYNQSLTTPPRSAVFYLAFRWLGPHAPPRSRRISDRPRYAATRHMDICRAGSAKRLDAGSYAEVHSTANCGAV